MFHVKQDPLAHLDAALADLRRAGTFRDPAPARWAGPRPSFASNDYLGLAAEPLRSGAPGGAGASRLLGGTHAAHEALEADLADWVGAPAALLFSSGYAANVSAVAALAGPGDRILSDALVHASLIDGARLSRAEVVVVPHVDLGALEAHLATPHAGRTLVVTESYFSMDADGPDLVRLRALCDAHGAALVVDEAHALGLYGPGGGGRLREAGVSADVLLGTLGKSLGGQGAFVAGSASLRAWLYNRGRGFVFSTGTSPAVAATVAERLRTVRRDEARRARPLDLAARLRRRLLDAGLDVPGGGPIVPVVVGEARRTVAIAERLQGAGFHVLPVRPPTVPEGTARLRVSVTARHVERDVDELAVALVEAVRA